MDYVIMGAQLILSLSILVVLHELGHFIPAKLFKTKVERFFLFFDPKFALWQKKIGETVYGIGWLPLGGYVKIAGMIDESMDTEQMKQPAQPWEFRSKPAWQRLIIMLGGVTVNAILAVIIYAGIFMYWGETFLPSDNAKYGIMVNETGEKLGLQNGDMILAIDGKKPEKFNEWFPEVLFGDTIRIERKKEIKNIYLSPESKKTIFKGKSSFLNPRIPAIIGGTTEDGSAKEAGLKEGDEIIEIDDNPIAFFDELQSIVSQSKKDTIYVKINRVGEISSYPVKLKVITQGGKTRKIMGIAPMNEKQMQNIFSLVHKEYNFFEALPKGTEYAINSLKMQIRQFKLIFQPETEAYKEVGSVFSIAKVFGGQWDWYKFWSLTAMLSIWLAFLNLLPIPALDGGHAVFVLYEMITRRPPSQRFMEIAQTIGFVILASLMISLIGWDAIKNLFPFLLK
jgi:regulator of sigma E protease